MLFRSVGIPAEHLPRVFDRFYRVDASRATAMPGTGLGLAIVKTIVELHGGSATIESELGKGTLVTLIFPLPEQTLSADHQHCDPTR